MTKPPIRFVASRQPNFSASISSPDNYGATIASTGRIPNLSGSMHGITPIGQNAHKTSPVVLPTLSVPPMAGRSYNEMIDYAEQQRKQIEANRREEERRQSIRIQNGQDALQRVQSVRRDVAEEEGELRRLSELERETRSLRSRNIDKKEELEYLSSNLEEQQRMLRATASRVKTFRRQIEELYRRRQTAVAAAIVEQRKMQQQQQLQHNRSLEVVQSTVNRGPTNSSEVVRPRASVEPFQIANSVKVDLNDAQKQKNTIAEDFIDSPTVATRSLPSPPDEPSELTPSSSQLSSHLSATRIDPLSSLREDGSPSPPKDPHPTLLESSVPPEKPLRTKDPHQMYNSAMMLECHQLSVERPISFADSLDESKLRSGKTDLVSLRSDSLKATKRRSWAASEGTSSSEAETIRRILEEQKRGRTHFIPELPTEEGKIKKSTYVTLHFIFICIILSLNEKIVYVLNRYDMLYSISYLFPIDALEHEKEFIASSCSDRTMTTDEESSARSDEDNVEFDPLALMLDAALEGELELVKASASKLSDVSAANDEGITALHNAICAGHYEIVKFLIESDANVNAQDSDGWTPLHCVYAAYDYDAEYDDELTFKSGDELKVVSKDDKEKNWWTCERLGHDGEQGLVPRTYVALYPALKHREK
uniref:SH3 domain-containing protein n=1 Tax=Heterorhabditis bacteriophora TaxID=37862 RepID=A0A1I7XK66_HETBA